MFVVISLATLALGASIAQTSSSDRAYTLAGTWACAPANGSQNRTIVFVRTSDGLRMSERYVDAVGNAREESADFRYDAASATWQLNQPKNELAWFLGKAGPWTSQTWTFDGNVYPSDPGDSVYDRLEPARVTFIAFGDDAFELLRSQEVGGQWVSHDPWESAVLDVWCSRETTGNQ